MRINTLRRLAVGTFSVLATVSLGVVASAPAQAAGPRPLFQLPFTCAEQWLLNSYDSSHAPALDMVRSPNQNLTEGSLLLASAGGVVNQSYDNPSGAGNIIQINHGGSWFTTYIHLQSRSVVVGQSVAAGQVIGRVGHTGVTSNGTPHLHYEQGIDKDGNGSADWGMVTPERVAPAFNGTEYATSNNRVLASNNGCAKQVYEASSANGWTPLPVSGASGNVTGSAVASLALGGTKFIYTLRNGQVYEASSANGWNNLNTGIGGASGSALSVISVNSTKFIYTVINGQVHEASSGNSWIPLPTGITGVSESALAAINWGGTKFIYTVKNGQVYEASSANGWNSLPTGISGVNGSAIAALSFGSAKLIYTIINGLVHEASSTNSWANLNSGISGVSGAALSAIAIDNTKFIYTVVGGTVHEASSANGWANLNSGLPASAVAAIKVGNVKFLHLI